MPGRADLRETTYVGAHLLCLNRGIELVAVRTADVSPGPDLQLLPAEALKAEGPTRIDLDGATCWIPPGWVGVRDGTSSTLRLTNVSREREKTGT